MKLTEDMLELDIDEIDVNPNQPRKYFDIDKIEMLAESIKEAGLDSPLQLIWYGEPKNGKKAMLKDGERRYRALKLAGISKLKYGDDFIFVDCAVEDMAIRTFISCCMREDLRPVEKAMALKELMIKRGIKDLKVMMCTIHRAKDFIDNDFISESCARNYFIPESTVRQVASDMKKIGMSGTNAIEILKILDLPKKIREKVIFASPNSKIYQDTIKRNRFGKKIKSKDSRKEIKAIPLTFGYELTRVKDEELINFFLQKANEKKWTARKLNLAVSDFISSGLTPEKYIEAYAERCKKNAHTRGELDKMSIKMDNFSTTLTSFRTINLFALSDNFSQKQFLLSGQGLRTSCLKLNNALEELLFNAKQLVRVKEVKRINITKLPFRVKMTAPAHSAIPSYRFSIPIDVGRAIAEQCEEFKEGFEVELQINAVFKPMD